MFEYLFDDPMLKPWDYDPPTLLPSLLAKVTFRKLDQSYKAWITDLRSKRVEIRPSSDATAISLVPPEAASCFRLALFISNDQDHMGKYTGSHQLP